MDHPGSSIERGSFMGIEEDEDGESLGMQVERLREDYDAAPDREGRLAAIHRHISPPAQADLAFDRIERGWSFDDAVMAMGGPGRDLIVDGDDGS
jgi:hypothetical protein